MKKARIVFVVLAVCLLLAGCGAGGKTKNVEIQYGESNQFTQQEIKEATDAVLKKFPDFEGCTLLKLWYDEERSNKEVPSYLTTGRGSVNGATEGNVIVLLSNFAVDASGGDGSFNPGQTYTNWMWILIREDQESSWTVDCWGY